MKLQTVFKAIATICLMALPFSAGAPVLSKEIEPQPTTSDVKTILDDVTSIIDIITVTDDDTTDVTMDSSNTKHTTNDGTTSTDGMQAEVLIGSFDSNGDPIKVARTYEYLREDAEMRRLYAATAYDHNCKERVPEFPEHKDETCDEISQKILSGKIPSDLPLIFPKISNPAELGSLPEQQKLESLWLKHAEIYHLAGNVSDVQRHLLCRPYDALNQTCSIGVVCNSSNIQPGQKFLCDTRTKVQMVHQRNKMLLEDHSRHMFESGITVPSLNEVDIKAPADWTKRTEMDTTLYTLGSLYMILKESENHVDIYDKM